MIRPAYDSGILVVTNVFFGCPQDAGKLQSQQQEETK